MKLIVATVVLLLLALPARAQTPDAYTFRAYTAGAAQPIIAPFVFASQAMQCNQAPLTNPSTVNPTRFAWDDTINAGKVCIWTDPGTGPLFSTPISTTLGQYEGTLTATNTGGTSVESNRAPFSRAASLAAPSNFRVIR